MGNDDVSSDFECDGYLFHNIVYSNSGGNAVFSISRILAFLVLFGFNYYNKTLLQKKLDNVNVVKGLILPFYFQYIYMYLGLCLGTGVLNLVLQYGLHNPSNILVFIMPVEIGLFHCLSEGLAFYLIRHGAGINAIYRALSYGLVWGAFTTITFFFVFAEHHYDEYDIHNAHPEAMAFAFYMTYTVVILLFYLVYLVVPLNLLYRRPAMQIYALWNVLYSMTSIVLSAMLFGNLQGAYCAAAGILFVYSAIIQPVIIFLTLQKDSQYWQGLFAKGPMSSVWESVDLRTADSIASNHDAFHRVGGVPVIHFGLVKFDESANFVAGGFSRVYFGEHKNGKVAMKVMFAMELTPDDVHEFYREATVLANLQHTNVVKCIGVCVMPPMLTLVLEYCHYGSLFDFLYKAHEQTSVTELGNIRYRGGVYKDSTTRGSEDSNNFYDRESSGSVEMPPSLNPMNLGTNNRDNWLIHQDKAASQATTNVINPISIEKVTNTDFRDGGVAVDSRISRGSALSSTRSSDESKNEEDSGHLRKSLLDAYENKTSTTHYMRDSTFSNRGIDRDSEVSTVNSYHDSELGSESLRDSIGAYSYDSRGKGREKRKKKNLLQKSKKAFSRVFRPDTREKPEARPVAHSLTFRQRLQMMRDCVCAIAFLHAKGYLHCDVKSLNFLVTVDFRVKLADMGESRLQNRPPKNEDPPRPAKNWCPPEVLKPNATSLSYVPQSDIYGLAIVLAELVLLELPFGDLPNLVTTKDWLHILTVEHRRPSLPAFIPPRLRSSVEQAWNAVPTNRPTAAVILAEIDNAIQLNARTLPS